MMRRGVAPIGWAQRSPQHENWAFTGSRSLFGRPQHFHSDLLYFVLLDTILPTPIHTTRFRIRVLPVVRTFPSATAYYR